MNSESTGNTSENSMNANDNGNSARGSASDGSTQTDVLGQSRLSLILILGMLTTLSPVSIDMYLPAFQQIANDLHTSVGQVSLSLSSYFIGLAGAQLIYGPLLDRFGRKRPVLIGLAIYALASVACIWAPTVQLLIAFRLFQAIGGCGAQVGAMAMVRDFFPARESAKIFSLLVLILGVSPMLAPTAGAFVVSHWGWVSVFGSLMIISLLIMAITHFFLPEGHQPDKTVSLRPIPIAKSFREILVHPQFATFAWAGAFAFSGLLLYVTCSPIVFMKLYQVTPQQYGAIFAALSVGFIGSSQLNVLFAKKFRSEVIFHFAVLLQLVSAIVFTICSLSGWTDLSVVLSLFFVYLSSVGVAGPNATALALAPFSSNAGRASSLVGFLQLGLGALASAAVGLVSFESILPVAVLFLISSSVAVSVFLFGRRKIVNEIEVTEVVGIGH